MYVVFKNNRPVGNKKFSTYEQARQWARKLCRRVDDGIYLIFSSNPNHTEFGYTIRRV
ncbi:MAG: hypothetical protein QXL01_04755 [Thermoplasmatales archaeon]